MNCTATRIDCRCITFFFLCLLSLGGCALSPQTISINPDIDVQGNVGQSQTIQVDVVDKRNSPVLGQRGGVYEDTSNIMTSDNMTTTLRKSLVRALQKQGYSVVERDADTALRVEVNSMTYNAYKEKLLYKIEIGMAVRSIVNKNSKEFTGDYKTSRKKDYVKLPGVEENEKLVNETLAGVLKSMLSDEDLIKFIRE